MKKVLQFTVPGPLLAYRRPRDSNAKKAYKKYTQFKNLVLALAMEQGWKGRTEALMEFPVRLSVHVRWNKRPHSDWSNVFKAVEDGLFSQDRYVKPGQKSDFEWNAGVEEAIVTIEYESE
jgi:hypothetical protein